MRFAPIAVVGQAVLLPGARTPAALWDAVLSGRDLCGPAPEGRWRLSPTRVLVDPKAPEETSDRAVGDRGGYVSDFPFDPAGFEIPAAEITGLDPLFHWLLHTAREALSGVSRVDRQRTGLVAGNLSYPSSSLSAFAEAVWLGRDGPDPRNRFQSGLPALLTARALGLGAGAFALDAACASSLYALKYACDRLQEGTADTMLAGAVQRADDLFLHVGFTALKALSRTGRSRPFHRDADGLLPAEGAAMLVLKRLEDATRDGDEILGVIRGIGLSNDGRAGGFLAPSSEGQVRAIRAAWESAGLDPTSASLVECHATGTVVGDATEIESMKAVFGGCADLPVGSLKGNLGHAITVAGAAGLVKVLLAMRHGVRPPGPGVDAPTRALSGTPFRVPSEPLPWPAETGRIAGVSAFGFGGNNAHVVVGPDAAPAAVPAPAPRRVALVGLGALVGNMRGAEAWANCGPMETIELPLQGSRFPPKDLAAAMPQQLAMLAAALDAVQGVPLTAERTGVWIGMQCDAEIARYGLRWRISELAPGANPDAVIPVLTSAGVTGAMPNIPANRLNHQLDLKGPSHTVSAEEASGLVALQLARNAIRREEIDAALVGAVDLCCEPVHVHAAGSLAADRAEPAADAAVAPEPTSAATDAAVALVLMAEPVADRLGVPILGFVRDGSASQWAGTHGAPCHAAQGLLEVGRAWCSLRTGGGGACEVRIEALGGANHAVVVEAEKGPLPSLPATGRGLVFPAHLPPMELGIAATADVVVRPGDAVVGSGDQLMPRAPALPPTSDDNPHVYAGWKPRSVGSAHRASATPPTPQRTTETPQAALPHRTPATPEVTVLLRQLGEAHRRFLDESAAVHRRFLEMRAGLPVPARPSGAGASVAPAIPPVIARTPTAPSAAPTPEPAPAAPVSAMPRASALVSPAATTGPCFDRASLEIHASGRISEIFGTKFAGQDGFERQVRMPEPPLLLADRVTGIAGEPMSMGKGTIWTETDIREDSWYLNQGYMPAGVLIESGQADLMLISWLGIDAHNRGERVYRLLGCDLTYHRSLPRPGDTLRYDIHVDGHAQHGDVRLFFFHYDCRVGDDLQLTVRNGQAGFFTDEELEESAGILWTPEEGEHDAAARLDPPATPSRPSAYTEAMLEAFATGDAFSAFGPGFELLQTHNRTPAIQPGRMRFLHRVTDLAVDGGPWRRGYLRAEQDIRPDDWFFAGHFKNDPCMPGTLMFEGCLQAMAFYLAALGYTLDKDGWRFEPVPEHTVPLRCRGQVDPDSTLLVYEVFVEEVHNGPYPTLYADLLCTSDGLKAFHARRMALRLVPDWPLTSQPELLKVTGPALPCAEAGGFRFDYASLLACAWGRPSEAFGLMYRPFDGVRRVARLPGPPYHFMSRVTRIDGKIGDFRPGATIEIAYDVPPDAWYFRENGTATMPFCVFLEAALQPCGWLASFVGSALTRDVDLLFRNLDGTGRWKTELLPTAGTLRTVVRIESVSNSGGMIIESFDVHCFVGETEVYEMKTVFGFFPKEAFLSQVGIVPTEADRAALQAPNEFAVDLTARPARYCSGAPRLPSPMLLMLDRITGYWPLGGAHGKGRVRAEKDVDSAEWFFKAHFFQDPVQPGSLGLEALIQLLQFYMIEAGLAAGIPNPRFEPLALDVPLTWKYRGQVVPRNRIIRTEIDIVEVRRDEQGVLAIAEGYLWVDELRIYQAKNLGMRIVAGGPAEEVLDPARDRWIADHCPTYTLPALPFLSMVDRLAAAAEQAGGPIHECIEAEVHRWVVVDRPTRLVTSAEIDGELIEAALSAWREASDPRLSRFEVAARATFRRGPRGAPEVAPEPLADAVPVQNPYDELFHGPAFHLLVSLEQGSKGASATLDAGAGAVPFGHWNQGLLDAVTHAIPHAGLSRWCSDILDDLVAYPRKLTGLRWFAPPPKQGLVRCEVRFAGMLDTRSPAFDVHLSTTDGPLAVFRLVEVLLPKGPLGRASAADRRAFLGLRKPVPGVSLSSPDGGDTVLVRSDLAASKWLPGTIEAVYGAAADAEIAAKEHVARQSGSHPFEVLIADETATTARLPLTRFEIETVEDEHQVRVRSTAPERLDLTPIATWWDRWFQLGRWPVEDLYYGLIGRFVRRVVIADPTAFEAVRGKSVLYLANHQVGVESLLFSVLASALNGVPTVTLAKVEHRHTWLGKLIQHCFVYPGCDDPKVITYFDRSDRNSLPGIIAELGAEMASGKRSVMVHVEGTRALSCRPKVAIMSSAFVDMAVQTGCSIVPVRFVGGLPVEPLTTRIEFPVGMGKQDVWLGAPIHPSAFDGIPYKERKHLVLAAINGLGPDNDVEEPQQGDDTFARTAEAWMAESGASHEHATLYALLRESRATSDGTAELLAAIDGRRVVADPWLRELERRLAPRIG